MTNAQITIHDKLNDLSYIYSENLMTEEKSSEYPLTPHARVQRGHYMVIIRLLTFARVEPLGVR